MTTTPTATIFLPWHALDEVHQRGTRAAQPLASAVVAGTLYSVTDEGDALERSDGAAWAPYGATAGGQWQDVPYSAANFSVAAGTWTVGAGSVLVNHYTRTGQTITWVILLTVTTLSAPVAALQCVIPEGLLAAQAFDGMIRVALLRDDAGVQHGRAFASGATVTIVNDSAPTIIGTVDLQFTITFEVA